MLTTKTSGVSTPALTTNPKHVQFGNCDTNFAIHLSEQDFRVNSIEGPLLGLFSENVELTVYEGGMLMAGWPGASIYPGSTTLSGRAAANHVLAAFANPSTEQVGWEGTDAVRGSRFVVDALGALTVTIVDARYDRVSPLRFDPKLSQHFRAWAEAFLATQRLEERTPRQQLIIALLARAHGARVAPALTNEARQEQSAQFHARFLSEQDIATNLHDTDVKSDLDWLVKQEFIHCVPGTTAEDSADLRRAVADGEIDEDDIDEEDFEVTSDTYVLSEKGLLAL